MTLDGGLLCSSVAARHPTVLHDDPAYFSLHLGGEGWIWPFFVGGCAMGWLEHHFTLRVSGDRLLAPSGAIVGDVSAEHLRARNFDGSEAKLRFELLEILVEEAQFGQPSALRARVEFTHAAKAGRFVYTGEFRTQP